jgi:ABC-2 type transport system ATP-binding protein
VTAALAAEHLKKSFRKPFTGARVEAVRDVSFSAEAGEVFGFVGPNGAGKTTTIKMIVGLIFPTSGTARVFDVAAPSREAMKRVGFLPESPYIYPYLTPREFVTMCARLSGLGGSELQRRVMAIIERVGMSDAVDRPVRALSKGMTQRVGLAAALVHDPDLLILDEPMSGLDPVGRKDVRDLILEERARGKTVFFSTHILSDVETLCDRVCILRKGEVALAGRIGELLDGASTLSEVALQDVTEALKAALARKNLAARPMGPRWVIDAEGDAAVRDVVEMAYAHGAKVVGIAPKRETLEQLFVKRAL